VADVIPRRLIVDCDGVLTDGTLTIDHRGDKFFKSFHTRDVRAIRELVFNGFEVVIVTADEWPGLAHFAEKVGADAMLGCRDKSRQAGGYIAIGDDAWDVSLLRGAVLAFAPADADPCVLALPNVTRLETCGGRGVVAELARRLLA
jgi:3-deoxy-D-manno-octulosonate 8-phosphate phosphatase KdsC-like HAD superfamily phosphatase